MKRSRILRYHPFGFLLGAVGIALYLLYKISPLSGGSGAAMTIVGPVIGVVYIVGFGILCGISLVVFLLIDYFHKK
jgi:hypothetical protein